jgi:hypothetical protein
MSASNARRHQTGRTEVADLGRRRTEKVLGLLHLRERLALAAAEYEAHDLDGAFEVLQQQLDVESAIRSLAPEVYETRWTEWLERDAALAHAPKAPHPECGHCQLLARRNQSLDWPPAQAS